MNDKFEEAEEHFQKNLEEIKRKQEEQRKKEKEWCDIEYKKYNE